LTSVLQIEVCRVLKQDEEVIYHAILKKLKPGARWTEAKTKDYLELAFSNWSEDIEILEGDHRHRPSLNQAKYTLGFTIFQKCFEVKAQTQ
jgi:hypothetical protein